MLALVEVDSYYGQSRVLHGLTLEVQRGEFVAVLGRNGTGKTTLLKTLMGLTDRQTGKIVLNGRDISCDPTYQRARAGIAFVPQGREIISEFSVRENMLMGAFARSDGRRAIPEFIGKLFPYLNDNPARAGGLLSGGQQQQLAIARALTAEPEILLLDEPTEGIQPNLVGEIEEVIVGLNRFRHLTIILVEQNISFVRRAADRFAILEKGHVIGAGPIGDLSDDLVHRHLAI
jgi:urea transport system ATP-binding protein